jgi:sporulation protein YlmC with PRC-barrel domain
MAQIKKTDPDKKYRRVLSASPLSGDAVRNMADEKLGTVDEIMLDVESGRVSYVVVSFGGVLGIGDKLFAIPWNAFTIDEDRKCFVLDFAKERLENAPGFDKDNWPDMADREWGLRIHDYYGTEPYWGDEITTGRRTRHGGGGI